MNKKPEELKKGLHCCLNNLPCEEECPYYGDVRCLSNMITDFHAYILTLEADKANLQAQNAELVKQVEHVQQDKDAVIQLLARNSICSACKNSIPELHAECPCVAADYNCNMCEAQGKCSCFSCVSGSHFEWCGVPEKEENNG